MILRGLLLCVAGMLADVGSSDADTARERIDALLDRWRGGQQTSEERLALELVAIGEEGVPYLCSLLGEPKTIPVPAVAGALGRLGGPNALEALMDLSRSEDSRNREASILALAETASPAAMDRAVAALEDEHPRVRLAAGPAIARLAGDVEAEGIVETLLATMPGSQYKDGYALAIARLDLPGARDALYGLLGRWSEDQIVLAALAGLWSCPSTGDGEVVCRLLEENRSTAVLKKSCLLMGRIRYGPAARNLIDLLHEDDPGLVKDAHWALSQITGLRMGPDPELWETWWERVGSKTAD